MRDDLITFKHKAYGSHVCLLHHHHVRHFSIDSLNDPKFEKNKFIHIFLAIVTHIIKPQVSEFRSHIFGLYQIRITHSCYILHKCTVSYPELELSLQCGYHGTGYLKNGFSRLCSLVSKKYACLLLTYYTLRVTPCLGWLVTGLSLWRLGFSPFEESNPRSYGLQPNHSNDYTVQTPNNHCTVERFSGCFVQRFIFLKSINFLSVSLTNKSLHTYLMQIMKLINIKLGITIIYTVQQLTYQNSIKELIYIKVFNHLPQFIKALTNDHKYFKSTLRRFLYHHSFYSMNEYYEYEEDRRI